MTRTRPELAGVLNAETHSDERDFACAAHARAYDTVVLAGGQARRLGGSDKATVEVGGRSLLDHALAATADARATVVVGPRRHTNHTVSWTREDPPGTGPLAGIDAGVRALGTGCTGLVVVLACDMPLVDRRTLAQLRNFDTREVDATMLADGAGRWQPLAAAYAREPLVAALDALGDPRDRAVRRLIDHLRVRTLPAGLAGVDCDTWADVAKVRRRHATSPAPSGPVDPPPTSAARPDTPDVPPN